MSRCTQAAILGAAASFLPGVGGAVAAVDKLVGLGILGPDTTIQLVILAAGGVLGSGLGALGAMAAVGCFDD